MKNLLLLTAIFSVSISFSQRVKNKSVYVKYITEPITVDAILDEEAWSKAKPATNFWEWFPADSIQAIQQTEIKMLFDDDNLYIGMKVYSSGKDYIIPSFRRDFRARGNDNITLMFDTFNDGTNAFLFGSNPYGVQREMLLSGGGSSPRDFNMAWDTKWKNASKIHDNYYILEWAIPLSAFKYREGETKWRFNTYRFDSKSNETTTWINIPQNQFFFNLAYMGDMIFEKPLGESKSPISIIPFINTLVGKDYETNETSSDFKVGGDAKFTINNSLNLDLTFNPDFSQVEVDQQVTNLTRFEVFLPERRQFFIDNSDLFADFGDSRSANPFFSRRIGIARDLNGNNVENSIIAGVRLSGKINSKFRIGVLNVQTDEDKANQIATNNNTVLTAQYKLFSRSNISFMFINKQATKDYDFLEDEDQYNRVFGVDYRLASADNTWTGKYYFHKSFSPNKKNDYSVGASTQYNSKNYGVRLSGLFIGNDFRSDLGFIRRKDIFTINPQFSRTFWIKKSDSKIVRHRITVTPTFIWKPELDFENSDYSITSQWNTQFKNNSSFNFGMTNTFTQLFNEFDPTRTNGAVPLPIGNYYYSSYGANFQSDRRKIFSYSITPSIGNFFNGKRYSFATTLNYRIQPYFTTSIQLNYDNINLPNPYPDAKIWLIGPRIDITFNKDLFWATFIQYSSQLNNFSINTRLQWRFAPLSDLFVVYNDNYFTDNIFAPRVRSFNVKLTYWLNI